MRSLPLILALALVACDSTEVDPEIVRYTGPPITEADATIPNEPFEPAGWSGAFAEATDGRFVTVQRGTICGDECSERVLFGFEGPAGADLPTSVEGVYELGEYLPKRSETRRIQIARVEIQDWEPDLVSGIVYPVPEDDASTAPYVFWTDDLVTEPVLVW